jgi:purine nucleosidase
VDDLLALVFLAHARELSLKGVTTVYGDTLLRARIAAPAWQRTGNENIPSLATARVERSKTAERFLNQNSHLYSGELEILPIGPLTNIAKAILGDSGFASRVKRLYLMGGAIG